MVKATIPVCTTCGREEVKMVPSRETLQAELDQLRFQEETLLRLLEKCRNRQAEKYKILEALDKK